MNSTAEIPKLDFSIELSEGGVICAFSGGSDSLGLLCLLSGYVAPINLHAVYVDHDLRPREELEAEIALNRKNCKALGVEYTIVRLYPEQMAQYEKDFGTEAAARILRYRVLEQQRQMHSFRYIATAHTREDQIETVLMRLFSGKALPSLAGIRRDCGNIIRPVLGFSHEQLRDVCRSFGLKWSEDSTNSRSDYLRNAVRNSVIPAISASFGSYESAVLDFASRMQDLFPGKGPGAEGDCRLGISLEELGGPDTAAVMASIYRFWDRALGADFVPLSRSMYDRISQAVLSRRSVNISASGVTASIIRGRLFITRDIEVPYWERRINKEKSEETIGLPGDRRLLRGPQSARLCGVMPDAKTLFIDPETVSGNLLVTQAKASDTIQLDRRTVKVSDLLKETGVPTGYRALVPVLRDDDGVVAVLGRAWGGTDRLCRKCRSALARNGLCSYIVV